MSIRLYALSTGEVRIEPKIEFDSIMVHVGNGSIFLNVEDAEDLIAALRKVIDDNA